MHAFPSASELQFLIGKEIGQIALDPYSLQFRFVDGGQITVENRIEHIDETGQAHPNDCQARSGDAIYLQRLLQHQIVAVEAQAFCLSMRFDDGQVLRIFSDDGPYECGQIYPTDMRERLIVF